MSRGGVVSAEMIAETALDDPANAGNPLLAPYRPGGPRDDNPFVNFYWDWCAPGKPAHAHVEYMGFADALRLIDATGGMAVLAHPEILLKGDAGLFAELVDNAISGVEAYSSYHTPEECAFWQRCADECGVIATCGSDFHGRTKPAIRMGCHGGAAAEAAILDDFLRIVGS